MQSDWDLSRGSENRAANRNLHSRNRFGFAGMVPFRSAAEEKEAALLPHYSAASSD